MRRHDVSDWPEAAVAEALAPLLGAKRTSGLLLICEYTP
jgi:hypothetical protein